MYGFNLHCQEADGQQHLPNRFRSIALGEMASPHHTEEGGCLKFSPEFMIHFVPAASIRSKSSPVVCGSDATHLPQSLQLSSSFQKLHDKRE